MADFCKKRDVDNDTEIDNAEIGNNKYRDETVMESIGEIDPNSKNYTESDDDLNAIAEGYR